MTCIAVKDSVMAADSLISGVYNTPAVKIYRKPDYLIGFAGEVAQALVFVDWYQDRQCRIPDIAHEQDWCALVLSRKSGIEFWDRSLRPVPILERQAAIGSGAPFAMAAMDAGLSAAAAVKIACKRDASCRLPIVTARLKPT